MIIKCTKDNERELIEFLEKDIEYNLFALADIALYGFSNPNLLIYKMVNKSNVIKGVAIYYFSNLILCGDEIDGELFSVNEFEGINTIMGKELIFKGLADILREYSYCRKALYRATKEDILYPAEENVFIAEEKDTDRIYKFLTSFAELRGMYRDKGMILNRIAKNEGVHIIYEKDDGIIAHINSAANYKGFCMLGGLAVRADSRGRGVGKGMTAKMVNYMARDNYSCCVLSNRRGADRYLTPWGLSKSEHGECLLKVIQYKLVQQE